jgi:hypothetical protein
LLLLRPGKSDAMSARKWLYEGFPTGTPSIYATIVDPFVGMVLGSGVNAHPKLKYELPETTSPCPGVSIAPNGAVADWLLLLIVRDPAA